MNKKQKHKEFVDTLKHKLNNEKDTDTLNNKSMTIICYMKLTMKCSPEILQETTNREALPKKKQFWAGIR